MDRHTTRLWTALLALSLTLSLAACGKDTTATTMHLKRTEGTVTVSDDAEENVPLLENLGLYSGYGVDTRSESYAWISLDDVKLTKMDQETEIAIQKEGKALDIEIISGSLFFNVTQPLEDDETMNIRTSTMLIGIRGTCGWVEDREGLSRAYILEGTVECVAGGNTVQVNAGEMAELAADGRLVVQPFTVQDIPSFVMDDLAQDSGLCSDIYNASGLDVLGTAGGEEDTGSAEGTEGSDEGAENSEGNVSQQGKLQKLSELSALDDTYESFGNAYGGVIPVKKNDMWGAVNYENEVIVPFEYTGFRSADKSGNIVLIETTTTEEIRDNSMFGGDPETVITTRSNEYFLFNRQGSLLYQGEQDVRASGGMYIIQKGSIDDDINGTIEYYSLDGTLLLSVLTSSYVLNINGFYDGKSNVFSAPYVDGEIQTYQIGTVYEDGSVTWQEEPNNKNYWKSMGLVNTMNNGYYLLNNPIIEWGEFAICDEEGNQIAFFSLYEMKPDAELGFVYDENYFNEDWAYRGFYHDGCYLYHYGPHMVLVLGEKDVLVDFTRFPGMTAETMNNSIVTAVYDKIYMSDENYWLVQNGGQYGYIDHDGTAIAMFESASGFYQQHAMIIENGHAYLINDDMEKLQDLGEAVSVALYGEMFRVDREDSFEFYQLTQ